LALSAAPEASPDGEKKQESASAPLRAGGLRQQENNMPSVLTRTEQGDEKANIVLASAHGLATQMPRQLPRRARLRKMTDEELIRHGKAGRYMCSSMANFGKPPRKAFVIQLEEVKAEWRRRHPKIKAETKSK
jgi:hypothetical protein